MTKVEESCHSGKCLLFIRNPFIHQLYNQITIIDDAMIKQPCVYILASKRNGTLYTGVTSNIVKRIYEHKNKQNEGFTKKYNVDQLVWFQLFESMMPAIEQEKKIKSWKRQWKIELIEEKNPEWKDLYSSIL